jgi:hypothetical protein
MHAMFYSYKDGDLIIGIKLSYACHKVGVFYSYKKTCLMGQKIGGQNVFDCIKNGVFNSIKNRVFIGIESIQ